MVGREEQTLYRKKGTTLPSERGLDQGYSNTSFDRSSLSSSLPA